MTSFPTRPYGPSGIPLSIVGFGGILVMNRDQEGSNRLVAEMVERGINYFDVAPSYGDAQDRLGPALEPFRKDVFLACKTGERSADKARAELEASLKAMRTDHFDLYQLHAITDLKKDVDDVFAKGGAMEVFIEAKKAGVVRHLGFSAHSEEAALAAMERYEFDSVLFPVNFCTWFHGNFGHQVMETAKKKNVSRLALKGLALQHWQDGDPARELFKKTWYEPITDRDLAGLALRWTLAQPITAAVPPGEEKQFRWALEIAENFKPITEEETAILKEKAESLKPIFETIG